MPALRVAEELRGQDASTKILFVTTRKKQDIEIIRSRNYKVKSISSGKLRRYFSLLNFIDPLFILIGLLQSIFIIIRFRPNVIFSKGGYLSLPVVFAGRLLMRKIIVHESDLKMGLANKISAIVANKVLVSFPTDKYNGINGNKIVYTGNPIRKIIKKDDFSRNTILIMGGSQGAKNINDSVLGCLNKLLDKYTVIHLTGDEDFNRFSNYKNNLKGDVFNRYKVFPKVFGDEEISRLLNSATIIVSRAGAGSICEASFLGKPLILIPLLGHQQDNASFLKEQNAAVLINDDELSSDKLFNSIDNLINNDDKLRELSINISRYSCMKPEAQIVNIIRS